MIINMLWLYIAQVVNSLVMKKNNFLLKDSSTMKTFLVANLPKYILYNIFQIKQ